MEFDFKHGANIYEYDDYEKITDFSSNTNPLGLPKCLNTTINIYQEKYTRYPDPSNKKLINALATYEQVDKDYLYIGNGASDIIFRIILALKPKKTLLLAPTFSEYEKACHVVNSELYFYNLLDENLFEVQDSILDVLSSQIDLLILCNPNNPTGKLINAELLNKIIVKCRKLKIFVMIDECFIDFVAENKRNSCKQYLDNYQNIVILKAFTKTFALAGFRLGYCLLNNKSFKQKLFESGPDWPISTIAQELGSLVLNDRMYLIETLDLLKKERVYLTDELEKLGIMVYHGQANYVFFKYCGKIDLKNELIKDNILIRSCKNYRELNSMFYRISIRNHHQNRYFIEQLKIILNNN